MDQSNEQFRVVRERLPSRQTPGACLSRQEVADLVNAWVFHETGKVVEIDANYIGKLERGVIRWPSRLYRAAFRAVLAAASDAELGFHGHRRTPQAATGADAQHRVEHQPAFGGRTPPRLAPWPAFMAGTERPRSAAATVETTRLVLLAAGGSDDPRQIMNEDESMDRRLFLTLLGGAVTSPAHEWLLAHAGNDGGRSSGHQLHDGVVDQLDAMTDGLRRLDDQIGGGQLIGLVREQLRTVIGLLEHRRYTEAVGLRLHVTAAELMRLAGWLSFDAGQHPQAQTYWAGALQAARVGGDRALTANVLGFMSCQAKDLGRVTESITLAEAARDASTGGTPKVAAILDLRAAQAYANHKSLTETRRAIEQAFARLDDPAPSMGEPGWCYWLDDAQANEQAGYCYLKLGEWKLARNHLRASLQLQEPGVTREGALRRLLLAKTYASQEQPDISHAVAFGEQALDLLTSQVDSARCVGHVKTLVQQLAPYKANPAVRQFADRALSL